MEVKIGIAESARELVVSSDQSADEVSELVDAALAGGDGLLRLVDEKGRRYVVRASQIAYVEIAPEDGRKWASPSADAPRPGVGAGGPANRHRVQEAADPFRRTEHPVGAPRTPPAGCEVACAVGCAGRNTDLRASPPVRRAENATHRAETAASPSETADSPCRGTGS